MHINQIVENIKTKEDFINFVDVLINDLKNNPKSWENKSLDDYLEAIQRSTEDMDGYYINKNLSIPENISWKFFAEILISAKMYE